MVEPLIGEGSRDLRAGMTVMSCCCDTLITRSLSKQEGVCPPGLLLHHNTKLYTSSHLHNLDFERYESD